VTTGKLVFPDLCTQNRMCSSRRQTENAGSGNCL